MVFRFSKEIYTKDAFISAAYRFTDRAYLHLDADQKNYIVDIKMKDQKDSFSEENFINEVLAQMVRQDIQKKTKTIRELIMARAFSSTLIEDSKLEDAQCYNSDISEILVDWFEKYE